MDIEFINIQNREEFAEFLADLEAATIIAADSETNGLRFYHGDRIISFSVYFPEFERAYNLPFRHGEGVVKRTDSPASEGKEFDEMTWAVKAKKQMYLAYWWGKFKATTPEDYFGNLPEAWMDEIKPLWGAKGVTYVFHNAPFDLHMFNVEGFPTPDKIEDTMIGLHLVHEDWGGIDLTAPYKVEGEWVLDAKGIPLRKKQRGNRQLKWQSMFWGFANAHLGEGELIEAKNKLEHEIVDFICSEDNLLDDINQGYVDEVGKRKQNLIYATYTKKGYEAGQEKYAAQQFARIGKQLVIDSKSNMWMLPSHEVATYAMLDTVLTWQLREKLMVLLEEWDNVERYFNVCDIQLKVAWEMEKNGLLLDMDEAERQINLYTPRVAWLEDTFNMMAVTLNAHHPEVSYPMNPASNGDIPTFMRYAVQYEWELSEILPDWIVGEARATMNNTEYDVLDNDLMFTNKEALRKFEDHPATRLLLEYRRLKKTISTYLNKWMEVPDEAGFIHPSLRVDGTVAGRFSSSGDMGNGQNIPERNGYTIKQALIAPPEHLLFAIDYGQLEARLAAWIAEILLPSDPMYQEWADDNGVILTGDTPMVDLFNEGADMHSYVRDFINVRQVMFGDMDTSAILTSVGIDATTMSEEEQEEYVAKKLCRQIAKTANFSLLYSGTYRVLMKLLHIEKTPAMLIEEQWRTLFPHFQYAQGYYETLAETWRPSPAGNTNGMYVTQPITGRHRKLHKYATIFNYKDKADGLWKTMNLRNANARKTWNNVVQGLGGWMSVDAALEFNQTYGLDKILMYLQIHDALDGRVHLDNLHYIPKLMDIMVDYETNPPLTVDLEVGKNWQPRSQDNPDGMWEVSDVALWVKSGGQCGYHKQGEGNRWDA